MRNPNGYGAIVKLGGKRRRPFGVRLTIGYNENGSQIYKYVGYYETRRDAMMALAEYNQNPYELSNDDLTFADVYEKWSARHFEGLSEASIKAYRGGFNRCKSIHGMKFKRITAEGLQKVLDEIESDSSRQQTKIFLSLVYRYAMKKRIVSENLAELADSISIKPKKDKQPFTPKEIAALWEHSDNEAAEITLMLIYTGFRITELLELKKENVFIDGRYVIGGKKTPAGKGRVVPIHKRMLPFFEKRLQQRHLFENSRGSALKYGNFLKDSFKPLMKELGMDHTPHDARHTFATMLHDLDINPLTAKRLLGHATKDVTDRYTHSSIQRLIDAVDKIL